MKSPFWALYRLLYEGIARPIMFRSMSAQQAHERVLSLLARLDDSSPGGRLLDGLHRLSFEHTPVEVGGVSLPHPMILAAGFVKGHGFADEEAALSAVNNGVNITPGWRSMPRLLGPVEFGSFTRWPRLGNPGTVIWRDVPARSTQNRVGLKNPGVKAAAAFLARNREQLPTIFGINIAVSPGVSEPEIEEKEVLEGLTAFTEHGIRPAWFTLNLSCPNTKDDPGAHQTVAKTERICGAAVDYLDQQAGGVPLWVKVSPGLAREQYQALMAVFASVGVSAVIATNTRAEPTPDDEQVVAGAGGARLHAWSIEAARTLMAAKTENSYPVDVIGCGGIQDGSSLRAFAQLGVKAFQYWSGLVYRGPLAGGLIHYEASRKDSS